MRRSEFFSLAALLALLLPAGSGQQQALKREGDGWVQTITGTLPAAAKLRVNGHGPVSLEGGVEKQISYSVKITVTARTEAEARRILSRFPLQTSVAGDWAVLNTPGGRVFSAVTVRAPRLSAVEVSTTEGAVDARGIDGPLQVNSAAGELAADRIRGKANLVTGGGSVKVGQVDGALECRTGAGAITVKLARGETVLTTQGGDIAAAQIG